MGQRSGRRIAAGCGSGRWRLRPRKGQKLDSEGDEELRGKASRYRGLAQEQAAVALLLGASGLLVRRAEIHQQFVALRRLLAQSPSRCQSFCRRRWRIGALLLHTRSAVREHVCFAVLRRQLHLDGLGTSCQGSPGERLLQRRPAPVIARRCQHLLGRDAAVHDPHPLRAPAAAFDGDFWSVLPRHRLVGQREPLRRRH